MKNIKNTAYNDKTQRQDINGIILQYKHYTNTMQYKSRE